MQTVCGQKTNLVQFCLHRILEDVCLNLTGCVMGVCAIFEKIRSKGQGVQKRRRHTDRHLQLSFVKFFKM